MRKGLGPRQPPSSPSPSPCYPLTPSLSLSLTPLLSPLSFFLCFLLHSLPPCFPLSLPASLSPSLLASLPPPLPQSLVASLSTSCPPSPSPCIPPSPPSFPPSVPVTLASIHGMSHRCMAETQTHRCMAETQTQGGPWRGVVHTQDDTAGFDTQTEDSTRISEEFIDSTLLPLPPSRTYIAYTRTERQREERDQRTGLSEEKFFFGSLTPLNFRLKVNIAKVLLLCWCGVEKMNLYDWPW